MFFPAVQGKNISTVSFRIKRSSRNSAKHGIRVNGANQ